MSGLRVQWVGAARRRASPAYAVFDGDKKVSGAFSTRDQAMQRLDQLARERARKKRPCLNPDCGRTFLSEGPHHRFCTVCRRRQAEGAFEVEARALIPGGRR